MWTAGWPPEENKLILELISQLVGLQTRWLIKVTLCCRRGLESMARGGTIAQSDHKEMLWSGARGKERPEVTQCCCHGMFYGILGGFYLFWRIRGQRVRSWCWASGAAGIPGPENKYTMWSAQLPSPQPITWPHGRDGKRRQGHSPMAQEAPALFPEIVDKMYRTRGWPEQEEARKPRMTVCREWPGDHGGLGEWETVKDRLIERAHTPGHCPCPAKTHTALGARPRKQRGPQIHLRASDVYSRRRGQRLRGPSGEKGRRRSLEDVCTERKPTKTATQGELGLRGGREEMCQRSDGCVDTDWSETGRMKRSLNLSFNVNCLVNQWWHVLTSPNPAFPRTSMTPSPPTPPRARVQAVRHMSSPRGTGGSLGLLRCHCIRGH